MTTPLEIDFREASSTRYEQLHFRQEGLRGLKLPGCWLPEFVSALESKLGLGRMCIYQDYHILNTNLHTQVYKGANDTPILSIDAGQRAKLIVHLKSTYGSLL